jgi:hypothetical protein
MCLIVWSGWCLLRGQTKAKLESKCLFESIRYRDISLDPDLDPKLTAKLDPDLKKKKNTKFISDQQHCP